MTYRVVQVTDQHVDGRDDGGGAVSVVSTAAFTGAPQAVAQVAKSLLLINYRDSSATVTLINTAASVEMAAICQLVSVRRETKGMEETVSLYWVTYSFVVIKSACVGNSPELVKLAKQYNQRSVCWGIASE